MEEFFNKYEQRSETYIVDNPNLLRDVMDKLVLVRGVGCQTSLAYGDGKFVLLVTYFVKKKNT